MQQINFYHQEFRPLRQRLSFNRLVLWLALVSGLALSWGLIQRSELQRLQAEYQQQQAQLAQLQQQQDQLAQQEAGIRRNPELPALIQQAEQQLRQWWQLQALLQRHQRQDAQGYSQILDSLALQVPDGLWLRQIRMGNRQLQLEGGVLQPELLGLWIERLAQAEVFAKQPLSQLEQSRDAQQGFSFKLDSALPLADDRSHQK